MYLILNSENKILNISRMARYVYRQPNGIVVLCGAEKAEAIYSDDSNAFYPIERRTASSTHPSGSLRSLQGHRERMRDVLHL